MAHVAVVGTLPFSLINFRRELLRTIALSGHHVTAMSAPASLDEIQQIESLGVQFLSFPVQRSGLNPLHDLRTFIALRKAFGKLQPDIVLAYTIKPVIFCGLALRFLQKTEFFALMTGLGYAFQEQSSLPRKMLNFLVSRLCKASLRRTSGVIFQNGDNRDLFVARRLAPAWKCSVVAGSGVDLAHFKAAVLPDGPPSFLCIARLLGAKGLREYAKAAGLVKQRCPDALFRLVGPPDPSPDGIPLDEVHGWRHKGLIEYMGASDDVRPHLATCHVYVLPSHHEGMPRTVLEAMATGRPILTTAAPGCKETVVDGENGFLVAAQDAEALADRMMWLIEHREQWRRMGQSSRRMAEERFDVRKVNANLLRIMQLDAAETM